MARKPGPPSRTGSGFRRGRLAQLRPDAVIGLNRGRSRRSGTSWDCADLLSTNPLPRRQSSRKVGTIARSAQSAIRVAHRCGRRLSVDTRNTVDLVHAAEIKTDALTGGRGCYVVVVAQDRMKSRRSALMVSACVVGMPCGKPWYVFSVPFGRSFADSGPESA